jgi:hypothetical protein
MHTAGLRATFLALLAAVAATLVLLAPASASPNKPYSTVICEPFDTPPSTPPGCTSANPAVIAPGGTTATPAGLSVTFRNDNKPGSGIQLGSDNLNTPAGFLVVRASLPAAPQPLPQCPASSLCVINGGTTVGFRNLNLAPGDSISINMSAVTPSSPTACTTTSPCFWTDEAKQSNDFNGTGNDLNSDSTSSYGTVMSAVASCLQKQGCSTTLANTATGAAGSISTTISTSSGKTAVTQLESLDFGPPLAQDKPAPGHTKSVPNCSNVTSLHLTYENLSNGADNGADRSQTVTIQTTDFRGYEPEVCFETRTPFTQLVVPSTLPPGTLCQSTTPGCTLAPANQVLLPNGTTVAYLGLLPDCGNQALQVNCNKTPGVVPSSRQTTGTTHTIEAAIPRGFDWRTSN